MGLGSLLLPGILEFSLRFSYSTLPSMAGLKGWKWAPSECSEGTLLTWPENTPSIHGLRLGVYGDSVAEGHRLAQPYQERFGVLLARKLSSQQVIWTEANDAHPGASWCSAVGTARSRIEHHEVEAALVAFFADDLAVHAQFSIQGQPVRFTSQATPWVRPWVEFSYLFNWIWLHWNQRLGGADPRYIHPVDQELFVRSIQYLMQASTQNQVPLLIALIPPIGVKNCPKSPSKTSYCNWMIEDFWLIARLLEQAHAPWVNLWDVYGQDDVTVPEERSLPVGGLAIHPNAHGHQQIADRLFPELKNRLKGGAQP